MLFTALKLIVYLHRNMDPKSTFTFGELVVYKDSDSDPVGYILNGQQRTTTIFLLLVTCRHLTKVHFPQLDPKSLKKIFSELLFQYEPRNMDSSLPRLQMHAQQAPFFASYIATAEDHLGCFWDETGRLQIELAGCDTILQHLMIAADIIKQVIATILQELQLMPYGTAKVTACNIRHITQLQHACCAMCQLPRHASVTTHMLSRASTGIRSRYKTYAYDTSCMTLPAALALIVCSGSRRGCLHCSWALSPASYSIAHPTMALQKLEGAQGRSGASLFDDLDEVTAFVELLLDSVNMGWSEHIGGGQAHKADVYLSSNSQQLVTTAVDVLKALMLTSNFLPSPVGYKWFVDLDFREVQPPSCAPCLLLIPFCPQLCVCLTWLLTVTTNKCQFVKGLACFPSSALEQAMQASCVKHCSCFMQI